MNVVVFENEYENVKASFAAANLIFFNKTLRITNYTSSQNCANFRDISPDSCIFVDIDLSSKSIMDGFEVIEELLKNGFASQQIIILTGHLNINEKAKERGLGDLNVITKPVDFMVLHQALARHKALYPPAI